MLTRYLQAPNVGITSFPLVGEAPPLPRRCAISQDLPQPCPPSRLAGTIGSDSPQTLSEKRSGTKDDLTPIRCPGWTGSVSIIEGNPCQFGHRHEIVGQAKQVDIAEFGRAFRPSRGRPDERQRPAVR